MLANFYHTTWYHIPKDSNLHITTVRTSDVRATIVIFTAVKEISSNTFILAVEKAIKKCHISCTEL
jgi:hypothetical protein